MFYFFGGRTVSNFFFGTFACVCKKTDDNLLDMEWLFCCIQTLL